MAGYLDLEDGELRRSIFLAAKTFDRHLRRVEDVTFLNFLLYFNYSAYKRRLRVRPRVISYFPRYNSDRSYLQYPKFYRIKLILYYPQREYEEVATYTNRFRAPNYIASYQAYVNSYQYPPDYFYNRKLEEARKTADNINKFKGDFADDLKLYQSFKALYASV